MANKNRCSRSGCEFLSAKEHPLAERKATIRQLFCLDPYGFNTEIVTGRLEYVAFITKFKETLAITTDC